MKQIQDEFEKMKEKRQKEVDEKTKKKAEKRIKKKSLLRLKKIKKQQEMKGKSLNKFPNDGSFLERFLQQQQQKTENKTN